MINTVTKIVQFLHKNDWDIISLFDTLYSNHIIAEYHVYDYDYTSIRVFEVRIIILW